MKRVLAPRTRLILLCTLACISFPALGQQEPAATAPDADEYAIYNLFVRMKPSSNTVARTVVKDQAEVPEFISAQIIDGEQKFERYVQQILPGVQTQTIADFIAKSKKPSKLDNRFCVEASCSILTRDEMNFTFRIPKNGWSNFYKKYPQAQGILSFSRVGFDQRKVQALVCVRSQAGYKMGAGHLVFLAKKHGVWVIMKEATAWIS
jgi:hypothetical protein